MFARQEAAVKGENGDLYQPIGPPTHLLAGESMELYQVE
jgi:hypothetical protein